MEHSAVAALPPVTRALVRGLRLAGFVLVLWLAGTATAQADDHGAGGHSSGQGETHRSPVASAVLGEDHDAAAGDQSARTVDRTAGAVEQPVRRTTKAITATVEKTAGTVQEPVRRTTGSVTDAVKRTSAVVEKPVRRTTRVVHDTAERTTDVVDRATEQVRNQVDDATGPVDEVVDTVDHNEGHDPASTGPIAAATTPERGDRVLRGDALASRHLSAVPGLDAIHAAATASVIAVDGSAAVGTPDAPVQPRTPAPTSPRDVLPEGNGGSAGASSGAPVIASGSISLSSPGSVLMPTPAGVPAFQPAPALAPGSTPD